MPSETLVEVVVEVPETKQSEAQEPQTKGTTVVTTLSMVCISLLVTVVELVL